MSIRKTTAKAITFLTSLYVGLLIAFLAYSIAANLLGELSMTKSYIANLTGLVVWTSSAFFIGQFIEVKVHEK